MPWPMWRSEQSTTMSAKHACARSICRLILHAGFLQRKDWGCRIWLRESSKWGVLGSPWRACEKRSFVSAIKSWQDNEPCDSAVFINQVIGMLEQYRHLAPQGTVELLRQLGRRVERKSLLHVNSTRYGCGVAEMLHRLLPLFEELGIKVPWEVMTGSDLFYRTTKSFHNALQGTRQRITPEMYDAYIECNRETAKRLNLDAEFAMIHNPDKFVEHSNPSILQRIQAALILHFLRDIREHSLGILLSGPWLSSDPMGFE